MSAPPTPPLPRPVEPASAQYHANTQPSGLLGAADARPKGRLLGDVRQRLRRRGELLARLHPRVTAVRADSETTRGGLLAMLEILELDLSLHDQDRADPVSESCGRVPGARPCSPTRTSSPSECDSATTGDCGTAEGVGPSSCTRTAPARFWRRRCRPPACARPRAGSRGARGPGADGSGFEGIALLRRQTQPGSGARGRLDHNPTSPPAG